MTSEEREQRLKESFKAMEDAIARRVALVDQLQAHVETNRYLMGEGWYQEHQAEVRANRLTLKLDQIMLEKKREWLKAQYG